MKITKLGHCCLLIETRGKRLLTDPGCFTTDAHSSLENIDAILFTHEHADHYHLDSLKILLENNPKVTIFANTSVAELLDKENIKHTTIQDGQTVDFCGIILTGYGVQHESQHSTWPLSSNTGFFIDDELFYPGDALTDPQRPINILALPVAGGWVATHEFIDYALKLKPRIAFPVHDHIRFMSSHMLPAKILPENGIEFIPMKEGDSHEF
ncbi:MBL fold metallo-hydrolase [Candidatus Gracilibacteria bacterium]|nr:MBL fold metallo-hydrolase [Candidatus Gracilibacteria bacterium]